MQTLTIFLIWWWLIFLFIELFSPFIEFFLRNSAISYSVTKFSTSKTLDRWFIIKIYLFFIIFLFVSLIIFSPAASIISSTMVSNTFITFRIFTMRLMIFLCKTQSFYVRILWRVFLP